MNVRRSVRVALLSCALVTIAACGRKVAPTVVPTPTSPAFAEFVYPDPPAGASAAAAAGIDRGWRWLQARGFAQANREFAALLAREPRFVPAMTGQGYLALAERHYRDALRQFDAALQVSSRYAPALVGKGQTLLALDREEDAVGAFEAALAVNPALGDVARRVEVLRLRQAQHEIEGARASARAKRFDEAVALYDRAIARSPDAAFLHHELALLHRDRGQPREAVTSLRKATQLDPTDAPGFAVLGELLEAEGDVSGAEVAYRAAHRIEPTADLRARLDRLEARAREARLPGEYRSLPAAPAVTRGDVAGAIGIRFGDVLASAPARQTVMTDIRGHWANSWITQVVRAQVMQPYANHAFQPGQRVRRVDLAETVSRLLSITVAGSSKRAAWSTSRLPIADVPRSHLSYQAVAVAVASGVMSLDADRRFAPSKLVTGADVLQTLDRVHALAQMR